MTTFFDAPAQATGVSVLVVPPAEPGGTSFAATAYHAPTGLSARRWSVDRETARRLAIGAVLGYVTSECEEC